MIERLGAEGDRGQRVVDLVRDPGGQEPDARQPLGPDELAAPLLDLPLEVGVGQADLGRHVVERLGQVLHLVAGLQVDLVVERPRATWRTPRWRSRSGERTQRWNRTISPQSMPRTMTAEVQTITRLVWYCPCDICRTAQKSRCSFVGKLA